MTNSSPVRLRPRSRFSADSPAPVTGPLRDQYGRVHRDLRISVTDRCNLRCVYCMPEQGVPWLQREDVLSFEEIVRVATIAKHLGIETIRITGGEPLLRRGIVDLIALLNRIGFADIAMTTNATLLRTHARALAAAGLQRINVSCDSLDAERFSEIRRRGQLDNVLDGIEAAIEAGLGPVKINVVLMNGVNDDEILAFTRLANSSGLVVRFIEFMPLDAGSEWRADRVVSSRRVLTTIASEFQLRPIGVPGASPADRYGFENGPGEIGVISTLTEPFCSTCDRLRLTADGHLRNCLFSQEEQPLRQRLRDGSSDEVIEQIFRTSVWMKRLGRGTDDLEILSPPRPMSMIGG